MNGIQDSGKLETRLFREYWQDGTLDLVAGGCLLLIGMAWVLGYPAIGMAAPCVGVPAWVALRQSVTVPRMGQVTFARKRQTRQFRWLVSTFVLGWAAFLLFIVLYKLVMASHADDSELLAVKVQWIAGLPPALLSVLSLCTAMVLSQGRYVAYAGLLVLAGAIVAVADLDPGWGLFAAGAAVFITGSVMFTWFVKRYPAVSAKA